jgi:hypothetical protein
VDPHFGNPHDYRHALSVRPRAWHRRGRGIGQLYRYRQLLGARSDANSDPNSGPDPHADSDSDSDSDSGPDPHADSDSRSDPEPDPHAGSGPDPHADSGADSDPEPDPHAGSGPEPHADAGSDSEPDPHADASDSDPTPVPTPTPSGVTLVVDPQGSLKTIQAAADVAVPGDTVLIRPGVYRESVRFNRSGTADQPITFLGADVVIDGAGFSSVLTGGRHITLKDLTVRNCSNGLQNYQAAVRTGTGWRMEDVTVEKVDATGICVMGSNVTLLRVIAQDNGQAGIGGDHSSDVYVKDCITRRNNRGVADPVWKNQTTVGGWKAATYVNGLYYVDPDWESGGGKWWATSASPSTA